MSVGNRRSAMRAPARVRRAVAAFALMAGITGMVTAPVPAAAATSAGSLGATSAGFAGVSGHGAASGLVNLAHLDFLGEAVAPPRQPGHTTYQIATRPKIGMLWTYAEPGPDGSFRRLGGGRYDPDTDTYGQGAFNADDISRAAVVYVRHWARHRDAHSQAAARELLRGLTYLQTTSGPNAGRVVLWAQPDGTLNPSAEPKELPDPSDSGPSYWLARTVWALGEGYAAFRTADPEFAGFLEDRLDLALAALERDVLDPRYGTYQVVDGVRVPAWLIVDGADATAEAMLGLAAYVEARGRSAKTARRDLARLARGVAEMTAGGARTWPYGAVLPWALSRSLWHGWGAQMPAALARAARALGDRSLLRPAIRDTAAFTSHLLVAGGPDNGWLPAPVDRTQIAYGVDSRVQSLLAVADIAGLPGQRRLAGVAASWYFGGNAAGVAAYDPDTGTAVDGIAPDGTVNRNSGAESTIHALLSMLALEAAPDVAAEARVAHVRERVSTAVIEAESGRLVGGARAVRPDSPWTGESQWSGGGYAEMPAGSSVCVDPPRASGERLVAPIVWRVPERGGRTRWTAGDGTLGTVDHGGAGAQGVSAVPGVLLPEHLRAPPRPGGDVGDPLCAVATGGADERLQVDAVLVQPLVEHVVLVDAGPGRARAPEPAGGPEPVRASVSARALLRGFAAAQRTVPIDLPGTGPAAVAVYDASGRLVRSDLVAAVSAVGGVVRATVLPGGFTLVTR